MYLSVENPLRGSTTLVVGKAYPSVEAFVEAVGPELADVAAAQGCVVLRAGTCPEAPEEINETAAKPEE